MGCWSNRNTLRPMSYKTEFPEQFHAIPEAILGSAHEDISWHNDAWPSFFFEGENAGAILTVDAADPNLREEGSEGTTRFMVLPTDKDGCLSGDSVAWKGDDENEAIKQAYAVAEREPVTLATLENGLEDAPIGIAAVAAIDERHLPKAARDAYRTRSLECRLCFNPAAKFDGIMLSTQPGGREATLPEAVKIVLATLAKCGFVLVLFFKDGAVVEDLPLFD